jgi:hypothetical protein
MGSNNEARAAMARPPRRGAIIALTVDATARPYDTFALTLGGFKPKEGDQQANVDLFLRATGGDVVVHTSPTSTSDLDGTAEIAAGGTLAFAAAYGGGIEDGETVRWTFHRQADRYLVVQLGSGTPVLQVWAASDGE